MIIFVYPTARSRHGWRNIRRTCRNSCGGVRDHFRYRILVSTRTARALHTDKLKFDERLAERKFEFDKELAERRFKYDRGLDDHKRRVALTEDVLTTFYHVKDVLVNARNPFSFGNEGVERPRRGDESEGLTRLRNSYYVPIARLNKEAEIFAKLYGSRYRFKAYFGEPADEPFKEIHRIRVEIVTAAEALIDSVQDGTPDHDPQFTKDMRDTICTATIKKMQ